MTLVRSAAINVNSLEERLFVCVMGDGSVCVCVNFFLFLTIVCSFQESPDAFRKTSFYSLTFQCVTGPSKLDWSYFPQRLNFAVGVQRSASLPLYYKSQIFKALWYKEAYCFKPLDEKKD